MRTFDFERARITWLTPAGSHGIWRVIAVATSLPPSGPPQSTALAPMIMAGDVYGRGRLPLTPPYSLQIAASMERHVILRDYGNSQRDTNAPNNEIFADLALQLPRVQARPIVPNRYVSEGTPWPLVAEVALTDASGVAWRLAFPISHLNHRPGTRSIDSELESEFQVETGPILIPGNALALDPASLHDGFALAYAFFNRVNRLDLAVLAPVGQEQGRRYSAYATLEGVSVVLLAL